MSILFEAHGLINSDRQKSYGDPEENLTRIADHWAFYIKQKYGFEIALIAEDVCWMMNDLKKARQMHAHQRDNLVDAAGYIGLIEKLQKPAGS